ncbi:hypothetical protein [Corynebacterium xerosis]|uniref:hypothetical protein n=1 Tax=Corynebacterium xerosis TaxID=1725 RepID=UPI003878FEC9
MGIKSIKVSDKPLTGLDPKAAVPVILFIFVFCLVIDNGFKFMTKPIAEDLGLSLTTASLQATLAGIVIGIGAVVYAALADSISMRKLLVAGIAMIALGSAIGFAFQGALLIGTLTSGIMATYVSWTAMFLVSLLLIAAVPVILKKVPDSASVRSHLDVFGLFLITVVGALSGKVGKVLSSRNTIIAALLLIAAALILPALFVGQSVAVIVISMLLFPSGFALIYAPLVATVLWILAGIVLVGLAIWLVADGVPSRREAVRATVAA